MSTSSIGSNYLQSVFQTLKSAATTGNANNPTKIGATFFAQQQQDQSGLSPVAQLLSTLQQLQQTDPAKYQQVTQQIATNLQTAAQTATSQGNTAAATQLNQLATDFTNASKNNQLPNIQDVAQAVGGHRHHHHAPGGQSEGGQQNNALNPLSIIQNTLSTAGIQLAGSSSTATTNG